MQLTIQCLCARISDKESLARKASQRAEGTGGRHLEQATGRNPTMQRSQQNEECIESRKMK